MPPPKKIWKFPNGPLIRGLIKEFIFSKIAWSPKSSTWEAAALKAVQTKDLGLQAILEKMNSLNTPWLVDHVGMFQQFLKNFDIFAKFIATQSWM